MMLLTVAVLVVTASLAAAETTFPSSVQNEKEAWHWMEHGRKELEMALERPRIEGRAKNVILFLGDGMGITANTAARILKGQKAGFAGEEGYMEWDRFPNVGLIKTYNLDKQVPDSAGTATAYLTGVKANFKTLGVNGNVKYEDCPSSLKEENRLDSIVKWAQDAGKATGVVTTAQVTHATPGGLYAKSASRSWQCDTKVKAAGPDAAGCKDIARQLVEDEPARNMKVIMGGGRQEMGARLDMTEDEECVRSDGRNLVQEWQQDKMAMGKSSAYATNTQQLRDIDAEDTDYIMGLFSELHVPYELDRDQSPKGTPHIKEMVEVALKRLLRDDDGFFLLVEGGRIDHGMHFTQPKRALTEVLAMEEALQTALEMVDTEETLIVVTADHSHVMTINGYPTRGNDILGMVDFNEHVTDQMPYTTLMFTNGHGFNYSWTGEKVMRMNLTGQNSLVKQKDYESLAAVPTAEGAETHGGEDVAAFAVGPMAHLFHRVHEQSYVAHVMAYASCVGPYEDCDRPVESERNQYTHVRDRSRVRESGAASTVASLTTMVLSLLVPLMRP